MKKPHPEPVFQSTDELGDGGGSESENLSGRRKALVFDHADERAHVRGHVHTCSSNSAISFQRWRLSSSHACCNVIRKTCGGCHDQPRRLSQYFKPRPMPHAL